MKPLYRFKYDFPNEKVHKQYINDAIEKLMSEEKLYQKYIRYRFTDKIEKDVRQEYKVLGKKQEKLFNKAIDCAYGVLCGI